MKSMALIFLIPLSLASSCNRRVSTTASTTESTRTVYVLKDTTITRAGTPFVSRPMQLEIECDEKGVGTIKPQAWHGRNGNITTTLTAAGTTIQMGTASDDCTITLTAARKEWEREHTASSHTVETITKYRIPKWMWWVVLMLSLANIGQIIYRRLF
jgi:hypothetical protein